MSSDKKVGDERGNELEANRKQMLKYAEDLNATIHTLKAAHQELQQSYLDTIRRLVVAAEYKDEDTGDHILRMSRYSALLAKEYGLSSTDVQQILYASPMHDIGKIGIPDRIMLKPGRLEEHEFAIIKTHTALGARILADSKSGILQIGERIASTHHEKWNGKGYPDGLSGKDIPVAGRVVGLADVFDALTSKRPYKDPYPIEVAVDMIKSERGEHFDPDLVDVFLSNVDKIVAIRDEVGSTYEEGKFEFAMSERDIASGNSGNA